MPELLLQSLEASKVSWRVVSIWSAKSALGGKRQADQMRGAVAPVNELNLHAVLS